MLAMRNRASLATAARCGCYFCLEVYTPAEITEYTDGEETALCPRCNVDAVVAGVEDKKWLAEAKKIWF